MNDYWLNKAAETESNLDYLRSQYEQMKLDYETRIADLERKLLEANCQISLTSAANVSRGV